MKQIFKIFIYFLLTMIFSLNTAAETKSTSINPNGETIIKFASKKFNVQVIISTHEKQIGKPSDERPDIIRSSCTYSRCPCSIVDFIDITVNGKSLFVPRSVFCDLADLTLAEIIMEEKIMGIKLFGGDASESYIAIIKFDADRIKSRIRTSAMLPDGKVQETIYYRQVIEEVK